MNDEEIKQGNNGNIGNNANNGIINYQMPQVNQVIWVIQVTWEKKISVQKLPQIIQENLQL